MSYISIRTIYSAFFVVLVLTYIIASLSVPTFYVVKTRSTVLEMISRFRRISLAAVTDSSATYVRVSNEDTEIVRVVKVGVIRPDSTNSAVDTDIVLEPGESETVVLNTSSAGGAVYAKLDTGFVAMTTPLELSSSTAGTVDISSPLTITKYVRIPYVSAPTNEPLYAVVSVKTYLLVGAVAGPSYAPLTGSYVNTKIPVADFLVRYKSIDTEVSSEDGYLKLTITSAFYSDSFDINVSVEMSPTYDRLYLVIGVIKEVFPTKYLFFSAYPLTLTESASGTYANATVTLRKVMYPGVVDADSATALLLSGFLGSTTARASTFSLIVAKVYKIDISDTGHYIAPDRLRIVLTPNLDLGGETVHLGFSCPSDTLITQQVSTRAYVTAGIDIKEVLADMVGG